MPSPHPQFILASASPRRRGLLTQAGYRFEVDPADIEEAPPEDDVAPEQYVEQLALAKASTVAKRRSGVWVMGADTVAVLNGRIIGKPENEEHAKQILSEMSGTEHRVLTGLAFVDADSGRTLVAHDVTVIRMRVMSQAEIDAYVGSGESAGKAGAYAIQETGDRFVSLVEGSFSNVVGLPLDLVEQMGRNAGLWK